MHYYNDFIEYINYKIKSFELTLDYIKQNVKDKYDIKKILNYIDYLEQIKMSIIEKQQEGYIFKKIFDEIKDKYREYNIKDILTFDINEDWKLLEPKKISTYELDDFKINTKMINSKKTKYPKKK